MLLFAGAAATIHGDCIRPAYDRRNKPVLKLTALRGGYSLSAGLEEYSVSGVCAALRRPPLHPDQFGRLLGTVDDSSSPRRSSRSLIREYFNHFLGDNERVEPIFPRFTERDVQFIDDKTVVYSGYYTFELTPKGGNTKIANAKFTYIVHRTLHDGVQLVLHNSGITPAGVVMKSSA